MTDRGTVTFGATKDKLAWFANLPASVRPALRLRHQLPNGFGQVVTPLSTGDVEQACEMYAGRFAFAGQIITASPSDVFLPNTAKPAWREAMLSLDWLVDFNASHRSLHDQYAMRLLHYWSTSKRDEISIAKQTRIVISLATEGQMIAQRCATSTHHRYFEIITQELNRLLKIRARNAEQSLGKATALLYCLNCFQGLGHLRELAYELIDRNLDQVILPDGGHISRDTRKLIAVLELVIPLQLLKSPIMPPKLSSAVENGLAMLKLLQCPDDRMPRVLSVQDIVVPKLDFARHSGFARIDHERATLIADTSTRLGLVLFDGKQRLIKTEIIETEQMRPAMVQNAPQGTVLLMHGKSHKRTCFLSADGHDLRIEDEFGVGANAAIIIQVAAGIRLSSLMEGQAVMLVLPDQSVWHLKQRGGILDIRQSGMHAEISLQPKDGGKMNWSLKKQAKAIKSPRKKASFETGLLI